ncbi:MAG: YbaB/EbfC family nucleoid-associated protein [Synergistaceae bacterium]|nr:YbaB/EbfC family nucleoid-associated protein [Synergistaceae bacterium]
MKFDKILKQAQKMQADMARIQEELANERIEGLAGGGMVKATVNGQGDILAIHLEREVIDPEDKEMLEDLIVAAINDAVRKSREVAGQRMSGITGGMAFPGLV